MNDHDGYGKRILQQATNDMVELFGPSVEIDYGTTAPARIDGAYKGCIAIELETRAGKQVRGAVLDLICHPFPKKLLVLMPGYWGKDVPQQCRNIMTRFVSERDFQVVVLTGNGADPKPDEDSRRIVNALAALQK